MYWNGKWFSYHDGSKWKSEFMPLLLFISFSIWISGSESTPCCKILFDSKQWIPRSGDGHRIQIGWMLGRRRVGRQSWQIRLPRKSHIKCRYKQMEYCLDLAIPNCDPVLFVKLATDRSLKLGQGGGRGRRGWRGRSRGRANYYLNLNVKSSLGTV